MSPPRTRGSRILLALAAGGLVALLLVSTPTRGPTDRGGSVPSGGEVPLARGATPDALGASASPGAVSLTISASPSRICSLAEPACPAQTSTSRVALEAVVPAAPAAWPAVQVVFAVDGTFFNGVYTSTDDPGYNLCDGSGNMIPCEESNGLPAFVAHAGAIAQSIQSENPNSQVTFALVDFESTLCDYGDCDGTVYRVDVGQFVPATGFGPAVASSFQEAYLRGGYSCADCDFWDNFLHAPSITAMYGVLTGVGVDWSPTAHHVVILLGDTAPRDPSYAQDYCVSGWDGGITGGSCYNQVCEPSFRFVDGVSPPCEGWVVSRDGNSQDSIAALARSAPDCVHSLGGTCTIDAIDLWSSTTDPYSLDWPLQFASMGGGPGGSVVFQNTERILEAGCDIAAATGGTWDGPAFFTCADGQQGSLQYVSHGGQAQPNLDNPTLLEAFRMASFGALAVNPFASGVGRPMFEYVPVGAISPAADLSASATCVRAGVTLGGCQSSPTILHRNGVEVLGWNWSMNPATNVLYPGDQWIAQFNIVAAGPPYATVPVDACTTVPCLQARSEETQAGYTSMAYQDVQNGSAETPSFPLAEVTVLPALLSPNVPSPAPPPPPPTVGLPLPIGAGTPLPVGQPIVVPSFTLLSGVSLNVAAVGLLSAGFTRIVLKNKPVAMALAVKSGARNVVPPSAGFGEFDPSSPPARHR